MTWTHGRAYGYVKRGCRCDECVAAYRAMSRKTRANMTAKGAPESAHGVNGYSNYGCRCVVCTDAWRVAIADRKGRRAGEPIPARAHGTQGGYTNWACRCDACRQAHREYAGTASQGSGSGGAS